MNDIELLHDAARQAIEYVAGTDARPAMPDEAALARLDVFDEPLPEAPTDPSDALRLLSEVGGPATMMSTGPKRLLKKQRSCLKRLRTHMIRKITKKRLS